MHPPVYATKLPDDQMFLLQIDEKKRHTIIKAFWDKWNNILLVVGQLLLFLYYKIFVNMKITPVL
jgi:hypothetical protein